MQEPKRRSYSYSEESPSRWEGCLQEFRNLGSSALDVPIFWGAHETIEGGRDFSKIPRLRLEKFLQIAGRNGLTLQIRLGFPHGEDTFPAWTRRLEPKAVVPSASLGGEGLGLAEIPSLYGEEILAAFGEYNSELFSILELYAAPGGPVSEVNFDWGPFEFDTSAANSPDFVDWYRLRYLAVEHLNRLYGTAFSAFEAVGSRSGQRALLDKRPWSATFDYRHARRLALVRWQERALPAPLLRWMDRSRRGGTISEDGPILWIDEQFIELLAREGSAIAVPCAPGGALCEMGMNALRIWDYFLSRVPSEGVFVYPLGSANEKLNSPSGERVTVVVNGKFIASVSHVELTRIAESGQTVFFPFGLPTLDDRLESISWARPGTRGVPLEGTELTSHSMGAGRFVHPKIPFPFDDRLWDRIHEVVKSLGRWA